MSTGSVEGKLESLITDEPTLVSPPAGLPAGSGLLDEVLARGVAEVESQRSLEAFLDELDWTRAVELWLGAQGLSTRGLPRERIERLLSRDMARLDVIIGRQVNAI